MRCSTQSSAVPVSDALAWGGAGPVAKTTVAPFFITLRRRSVIPGSSSRWYTRFRFQPSAGLTWIAQRCQDTFPSPAARGNTPWPPRPGTPLPPPPPPPPPPAPPAPPASRARHLVNPLVELDARVALQVGDDGPRLRRHSHDLRRRLIGRPAGGLARVGAAPPASAGEQRGQEQPSDLSLSASACRWSRHPRSFSRSLATTSLGARAMKSWFASFASSPESCRSSRASSPASRLHSRCTSISPSSATKTSLPSTSTAWAPTVARLPSNARSASWASRRIVSRSPDRAWRARSVRGRSGARRQGGLHRLDIPVGQLLPRELEAAFRRLIQPELLERPGRLGDRGLEPRQDPAIGKGERLHVDRLDRLHRLRELREHESPDVPQLVGEVAAGREGGVEVIRVEDQVRPEGNPRDRGPAQCVGPVHPDDVERIDPVAERLRHLTVLHVAHRAVQVDRGKGALPEAVVAGHDHPGDPEEQDLGRCYERVAGIEAAQVRCLVRPAEGRERPQPR